MNQIYTLKYDSATVYVLATSLVNAVTAQNMPERVATAVLLSVQPLDGISGVVVGQ